jgi:hypothetical protein
MKKLLLLFLVLSAASITQAQFTTESYFSKVPALPKDSCNIMFNQAENFKNQVGSLLNEVDEAIGQMNRNNRQSAKTNDAAMKEQAMKQMAQFGMSQEDMAKMKSGKMSAAEKQAFANKMMMQQTNISVDEMQATKNMSAEGKKAYSQALATEMAATGQAGQVNTAISGNATNLASLLKEQQQIMARISGRTQNIPGLYAAIENDQERQKMLSRIGKWSGLYNAMGGVDAGQGKQMDSLMVLIRNEQISYCNKFTPLYRKALRAHRSVIKSSLSDYRRLAELTGQIAEAQTGVPSPSGGNDITGMEAMKEYLLKLHEAYSYKLYYPDKN